MAAAGTKTICQPTLLGQHRVPINVLTLPVELLAKLHSAIPVSRFSHPPYPLELFNQFGLVGSMLRRPFLPYALYLRAVVVIFPSWDQHPVAQSRSIL